MTKIDLTVYPDRQERAIQRARERNIIIPTFEQMVNPTKIPVGIREELGHIGLWDIHPRNVFRITWKNQAQIKGGGFSGVNFV